MDGIGALAIQFEQLSDACKKIDCRRLFDDCHKQALPNFVKNRGCHKS